MHKKILLAGAMVLASHVLFAQDKPNIRFGKVTPADFDLSRASFDTGAPAVFIADVGSTEFFGNKKGWFSTRYKRQVRIKILNKTGLTYGNIAIPLYHNDKDAETLDGLTATAYNLENGVVVETKLNVKTVFTEVYNKKVNLKKFAIPSIKEGTLIEYGYMINSDFTETLHEWEFQGEEPRLWSQYSVAIPKIFDYVIFHRGLLEFTKHETRESHKLFSIRDDPDQDIYGGRSFAGAQDRIYTVNADVSEHTWLMKDVPALKKEAFTSATENYLAKISFQLSKIYMPESPIKEVMTTWPGLREELMKIDNFGEPLKSKNGWLESEMKNIVDANEETSEKARKIYNYVRDNFTCTRHTGIFLDNPLRTVWKDRKGSVAEINFMLIAMLRQVNIQADPLLISTRENGFSIEAYPQIDQFNYLVTRIDLAGEKINLDASVSDLGFERLPLNCYNGHCRVINETVEAVYLKADDLKESKTTVALISFDETGHFNATVNSQIGYLESQDIRSKVRELGQDQYFKQLGTGFTEGAKIKASSIDSLSRFDYPITLHYELSMENNQADILYINPMLSEGYIHNYFEAEKRLYPVEMPFAKSDTYLASLVIPPGYEVEEIPKSEKVSLNVNDGQFEYIVARSGDIIQIKSSVVFRKALYSAEDYNNLREFYNHILKKHKEQIILKKKA